MRSALTVTATAALLLTSCSIENPTQNALEVTAPTSTQRTSPQPTETPPNSYEMLENQAGEGGAIGCTTRDDCDVEFTVNSVSAISCPGAIGLTEHEQVVRADIEVEVRDQVSYPDALDIFNLGSWSAITEDGYTLKGLDTVHNCEGQDASLLAYGLNAGEKVQNRIDFLLPGNVDTIQLQPEALNGGGWNWPID